MEPATFAVSTFFSTFENVLNVIRLLQIAHNADRDSDSCLIKLAYIQCRLTRWAGSVGITNESVSASEMKRIRDDNLTPPENRDLAWSCLEKIQTLLAQAKVGAGVLQESTSNTTKAPPGKLKSFFKYLQIKSKKSETSQ